jgi:uncharacterized protein YkwD
MRTPQLALYRCFLLASSAILSGCTLLPRVSECEANPAQQLLVEINEVRVREGFPPVWPNLLLASAAEAHAQALAKGEATGHFGPEGSDPLQRISEAGYLPLAFGENTAMGSSDPRLVVEAWLASPGHRQVMLDPSVQEVGLGGVLDPDHPVWVANFGSQVESPTTRCHPRPSP